MVDYKIGIPESLRADAVDLYDEAFGAKFSVAVPDKQKRLKVISDALLLDLAVAAISDAKLVGIAGFQTPTGSLTKGITATLLFKHLGLIGGLRAILVFSLYERKPKESELLMDGIVVSHKMRGYGVGTKLLDHLKKYAGQHSYTQIRLDVIDTNQNAKRLYERQGFVAIQTEKFEYLRGLIGFGASTTMIYEVTKV